MEMTFHAGNIFSPLSLTCFVGIFGWFQWIPLIFSTKIFWHYIFSMALKVPLGRGPRSPFSA
jgi:hypothetical protein